MIDALPAPPALGRASPAADRPALLRDSGIGGGGGCCADGGDREGWALRAASLAGVRHRLAGRPGEDAFAWARSSAGIVLAVADGVGSVPGSGPAARRAVDAACSTASAFLGTRARSVGAEGGGPDAGTAAELSVGASVADLEVACREAVAAAQLAVAGGEGATTLVVAVVAGDGSCRLVRVGDSTALVLGDSGWEELFAAPEPDRASSATAALPADDPEVETAGTELAAGEALVLVTDGVGDPLRDGPETVAPGLAAVLAVPPSPLGVAWVVDFSRQGCHDDRTVIALWRRAITEG